MTVGLTIRSLPQAWRAIKEMNLNPEEGETDYRQEGRHGLEGFIRERMKDRINRHLEDWGGESALILEPGERRAAGTPKEFQVGLGVFGRAGL